MPGQKSEVRRIWRFNDVAFDEGGWTLSVSGSLVEIEAKPLLLLLEFLNHPMEIRTKDQLLDQVWPGVIVGEASLATAISKLRAAIGDQDRKIIQSISGLGYKLVAHVEAHIIDDKPAAHEFQPGDFVPGRKSWRLVRALGKAGRQNVWVARNEKTVEQRVFKFASSPADVRALQREVILSRVLQNALGPRSDLPRVMEWNFETAPMFLESAYGGEDLHRWADKHGGLHAIPIDKRLNVLMQAARAVARMHDVGIIHKDIKPGNIVINDQDSVMLVDFGSGRVLDGVALHQFNITGFPVSDTASMSTDSDTGTYLYVAPELIAGGTATIRSDIYALGVLMFQLVTGDFARVFAPGWEAAVADPLFREDIEAAANGDPAFRFASADQLADRLDALPRRQEQILEARATQLRMAEAKRAADRARARRPWVIAAFTTLVLGLVGTSYQAVEASRQRAAAQRQAAIAESTLRFLSDDLLAAADPALSDASAETVAEAARRASLDLLSRFRQNPEIAARLHHALGKVFVARGEYAEARRQFALSSQALERANPGTAATAAMAFEVVIAEAMANDEAGPARAVARLEQATARHGQPEQLPFPGNQLAFQARGLVAMSARNQPEAALAAFSSAARLLDAHPGSASPRDRLLLDQRILQAMLRVGQGAESEQFAAARIKTATQSLGATDPLTLQLRLSHAQALMVQRKHQLAFDETEELLPLVEKRFGADHPRVMRLLGARVDLLKSLGRYDQAIAEGDRMWQTSARVYGTASYDALAMRADTAFVRCERGQTAIGLREVRQAHAIAVRAFGPDGDLTQGIRAGALTDCLIAARAYPEADRVLAGVDADKLSRLTGSPTYWAQIELNRAMIAAGMGNRGRAQAHLDKARSALPDLEREQYWRDYVARIRTMIGRQPTPAARQGRATF